MFTELKNFNLLINMELEERELKKFKELFETINSRQINIRIET